MRELFCEVNYCLRPAKLRCKVQSIIDVSGSFVHQFALASYEIHS